METALYGLHLLSFPSYLHVFAFVGLLVNRLPAALPGRRLLQVQVVAVDGTAAIEQGGFPQNNSGGVTNLQNIKTNRSTWEEEDQGEEFSKENSEFRWKTPQQSLKKYLTT